MGCHTPKNFGRGPKHYLLTTKIPNQALNLNYCTFNIELSLTALFAHNDKFTLSVPEMNKNPKILLILWLLVILEFLFYLNSLER